VTGTVLIVILDRWEVFLPLSLVLSIASSDAGSRMRQIERGEEPDGGFMVAEVLFAFGLKCACFAAAAHLFGRLGAATVTALVIAEGLHALWRARRRERDR